MLASRAAPLPVSQPAPVNLPSGDVLPGGPQRGWLIASILSLYIIWGSTYLAIRWALEGGMPPFQMSGVRFVLAGALLFAVLWLRGAPMPTARQWGASALVGLLLLGVGNGGSYSRSSRCPRAWPRWWWAASPCGRRSSGALRPVARTRGALGTGRRLWRHRPAQPGR
ncbi:EamA family transporter [Myxococcus sp. MxC21-1]|uniref:EamA family transporter n=1 Tax=Myxococcus sp. MxC21-1 TaxID=3041439 RepID=UPI0029318397|nr:EamA family transporter [Myxococcus sp. MxC21-1]WNZ61515.1 EamA family transporter [Myxococcus sp. MxC21-1]